MKGRARAALLAAAIGLVGGTARASPARVAVVVPARADAMVNEAAVRLAAELAAAGFAVTRVEVGPGLDPREAAAAEGPAATVILVRTERGAAADVRVADRPARPAIVRRIDADATAEASVPVSLAIRAVELLRASLLEASAPPAAPPPAPAPSDAPWTSMEPSAPPKRPAPHALLEGPGVELRIAALYGMGDTTGRLAPVLRVGYGAPSGLGGRLTLLGTATDQLGMVEIAYGFDRSWRTIAPVASLGAGGAHTHIEASGGPASVRLRTRAWSAVLGGSAGLAARAGDRVAFVFDAHVLLAEPAPGAIVGGAPAAGKAEVLAIAALGVLAGF